MFVSAKRRSRAILGALIVAVLLVPVVSPPASAATTSFRDVTGSHQFYREISWLASKGITTGYANSWFRPDWTVSREEFAAFLYRLDGSPKVTPPSKSPFKDVKTGDKFYKQIVWLTDKKITTGFADRTFRSKSAITRDAMAAFLYRYHLYKGGAPYTAPKKSAFKDMKTSSKFFKEVSWMASRGISKGFADGTFRPYSSSTRAATAAFLFRGYGSSSYKAPKYVAPKVPWVSSEIIKVAKSQVGYREPAWRKNKYNTWIGGNSAWCSVYVSWVFENAGYPGYVPKAKFFDTSYTSGAASTTFVGQLKAAGVLDWNVSLSDLDRGDVVLINWNQGLGASHAAIVDKVSGNGAWFYEGNTTDGKGNSTRGVFYRWRALANIDAVFDPRQFYSATH